MRPEQVVRPGDVVQCKVTSVDQEKARVQPVAEAHAGAAHVHPATHSLDLRVLHTQRPDCCMPVSAAPGIPDYADDATWMPLHWYAHCWVLQPCMAFHGKLGHAHRLR